MYNDTCSSLTLLFDILQSFTCWTREISGAPFLFPVSLVWWWHNCSNGLTSCLFSCLQSEIPRHHRSREAHSRHNRRAERGRYRSVLAVGVGCAVAGGWICLATVVYVVRYLRAKRNAAARGSSSDNLLWNTAFYRNSKRSLKAHYGCYYFGSKRFRDFLNVNELPPQWTIERCNCLPRETCAKCFCYTLYGALYIFTICKIEFKFIPMEDWEGRNLGKAIGMLLITQSCIDVPENLIRVNDEGISCF